MSGRMRALPFDVLLRWILREWERNQSIFGIPRALFYIPQGAPPYAIPDLFGQRLATPIGPAAGPHTQLAQNIVCAWLSGARFIELKTVQVNDRLRIGRPCIDMEDEGYNIEWSQELTLEQSAGEYAKAWALIHVLARLLGFDGRIPSGTIMNMSVGYTLEGIQSVAMTRFMDRLQDASEAVQAFQDTLRAHSPQFADIEIPTRITNNVTLSTMHGCPPDEIERIARYLLEQRGLHTVVKLNPTLLGRDAVTRILHEHLGYREMHIPDAVFEHDLQYSRAVQLIRALREAAARRGLTLGIKLSNTLAMENHRSVLPGQEVYMSGRVLYPVTLNLFLKLAQEFGGDLNVSYSAGVDALNVTEVLVAGARPVTAASDLLKPGGYSRLLQYLENLETEMARRGARSLDELARDKMHNLERAAAAALQDARYQKAYHPYDLPQVASGLGIFDCITAPCRERCPIRQDIPAYACFIVRNEYNRAIETILARNPLPGVTGYVCTRFCQERCTRSNYDEPVAIRALKRFVVEHASDRAAGAPGRPRQPGRPSSSVRVAVIGSGPSGLAAAYFLARNSVRVTVFEAREVPGGMMSIAPGFRLPRQIVQEDVERIVRLGVELVLGHPVTVPPEELLEQGFDAVYVACGMQQDARLEIEGIEGQGVWTALDLLAQVARGNRPDLGARVLVIGGGNTALDAARTAQRLTDRPVTVVYRRTRAEMPAEEDEIADLLAEGNSIRELVSPIRVVQRNGRVVALECVRNELNEPGADGRRRPVPVAGSRFQIEADSVVVAIGQQPDLQFLDGSSVHLRADRTVQVDTHTGRAEEERIYAGGDIVRGPASIVEACADGERAALAICREFGLPFETLDSVPFELTSEERDRVKRARARREVQHKPSRLPVAQRGESDLVEQALDEDTARAEAARCLQCATVCDKCVEVCPNRANYAYRVSPIHLFLPRFRCVSGKLVTVDRELFGVEQERQIVHIDDLCNECGNCATFCVHSGATEIDPSGCASVPTRNVARPYLEKPRLFLRREDFQRESDNAFYLEEATIYRREGGEESWLAVREGGFVFENKWIRVCFSPELQVLNTTLKEVFEGNLSIRGAAEMAVILQGAGTSLPFL